MLLFSNKSPPTVSILLVASTVTPRSSVCGMNNRSSSSAWNQLCECELASHRRDELRLGLLGPDSSSWQGRSWELFHSRRMGGSASHCPPPPQPRPPHHHAHTHTRTNTCAYLATARQEELCVSAPDKVALLPESSRRGCERCYSSLQPPTKVRHMWIKVLQTGRWWETSKRSEKS